MFSWCASTERGRPKGSIFMAAHLKRAAGGEACECPRPPHRPRRAGPVGGNPTSVPGRVRRGRLESRYLELDLRHHIRRGVLFVTLANDRLGALGRFGVEVEKLLTLRREHAEHELAPDAPGIGLQRVGHVLDRGQRHREDGRVVLGEKRQSGLLDDELPLDLFRKPGSALDVLHIGEHFLRPDTDGSATMAAVANTAVTSLICSLRPHVACIGEECRTSPTPSRLQTYIRAGQARVKYANARAIMKHTTGATVITYDDFLKVDIRVGRIVQVDDF